MIAAIKNLSDDSSDSDCEAKQEKAQDGLSNMSRSSTGIFDLNVAEINEELSPLVYLVEACKSLEQVKQSIKPLAEIENEFMSLVKSSKLGLDKVFSCSHTLELLYKKFIETNELNEKLNLKVDETEKSLFAFQK